MIGLLFFSICADEGSAVSVSPNLAGIDLSVNSGTQHFNLDRVFGTIFPNADLGRDINRCW